MLIFYSMNDATVIYIVIYSIVILHTISILDLF